MNQCVNARRRNFLKKTVEKRTKYKFHDGNKFINKHNVIYKCFKRSLKKTVLLDCFDNIFIPKTNFSGELFRCSSNDHNLNC